MGTFLSSPPAPTGISQPPKPPDQIKPVCISEGKPQLKHRSQNHRFPSSPAGDPHPIFCLPAPQKSSPALPCPGRNFTFWAQQTRQREAAAPGDPAQGAVAQNWAVLAKKRHGLHLNHPRGFVLLPSQALPSQALLPPSQNGEAPGNLFLGNCFCTTQLFGFLIPSLCPSIPPSPRSPRTPGTFPSPSSTRNHSTTTRGPILTGENPADAASSLQTRASPTIKFSF